MEPNLSPDDRAFFEELLKKAVPYDDDDPILLQLDGEEQDHDRMMATIAKGILEGRLR